VFVSCYISFEKSSGIARVLIDNDVGYFSVSTLVFPAYLQAIQKKYPNTKMAIFT